MKTNKRVVLVAGGTGGHINAAIALGERLTAQDYEVSYLSGMRPLDYKLFRTLPVQHLASWPLRTKNPFKFILAVFRNSLVFCKILIAFLKNRPLFIVGAGGYVCGPTLLAGKILRIPVYIFEQNAVLGLTNKLLARLSNLIFTHFRETKGLPNSLKEKVRVVGNPTRQAIKHSVPREKDNTLRVLVFGGSLGASQINELVVEISKKGHDSPIDIIHQTGNETNPAFTVGNNIQYRASKYLDNIQEQFTWCDVIIARSGASTISELRIIKKPCLLIPFPGATDNHQWWNAIQFKQESDFTVEVVDPKSPKSLMLEQLESFLNRARLGQLQTSQSKAIPLDSSLVALREIYTDVGILSKE